MTGTTGMSAPMRLLQKYRALYHPAPLAAPAEAGISELWDWLETHVPVNRATLRQQIASMSHLAVHMGSIHPPEQLLNLLPRKTAEQLVVVPVAIEDGEQVYAIANPLDAELQETISFIAGIHHRFVVADPRDIRLAIAGSLTADVGTARQAPAVAVPQDSELEDAAIPKLARQLIVDALKLRASDLHLQPFVDGFVIRMRVDGLLQRHMLIPTEAAKALIRYCKARCGMDPTHTMVPQDGHMRLDSEGHQFDLRVSTLPVSGRHEKLVIRILNRQSVYELGALGFSHNDVHTINRLCASPSGVILVCGPTGSGKTTTLYSILSRLNREDTSIMTVENPVEYEMAGLSQTEINEKAGMTFPRALRAILRQDPDVLLIGEIRDHETAEIALQAALTGHLVFATLHTNDSLSAIPRLLDLGIKPVILSEALAGIVSQRLVRRLCRHCKQPLQPGTDPLADAFHAVTQARQACRPVGCEHCNYKGFSGRAVIAEMVEINQKQRQLLLGGANDINAFKAAVAGDLNTITVSASRLIISGETTAAEASGVIGMQFWIELAENHQTELPDLGMLGQSTTSVGSKVGVLITGDIDDDSLALQQEFEHAWFDVFPAASAEAAEAVLRKQEHISAAVVDLAEGHSETSLLALMDELRVRLAWAHLPAVIRVPESRPEFEHQLKQHGSFARFVHKSVPLEQVVGMVQRAVIRNLDFRWGADDTTDEPTAAGGS